MPANRHRQSTASPERSTAGGDTGASRSAPASLPAAADDEHPTRPAGRHYDSLKAFLSENSLLIVLVGSLTSLSTFLVNLDLGWLDTYLKAVLLAAAAVIWFELHAQWPDEVQLQRPLRRERPRAPWRLLVFSYLMQFLVVLFIVWSVVQAPEVVVPILTMGTVWLVWHRAARGCPPWLGVVALVIAFVVSEVILELLLPHRPTLVDLAYRSVERFSR